MEIAGIIVILFVAFLVQGWLFNRFASYKLEYSCEFSADKAHEGDEIFLVETVFNNKLLPIPWLKVDIHSSKWLDFAESYSLVNQDSRRVSSSFLLRSYQKTVRKWKLKCLKRGVFTIENATLVWGDPLGSYTTSRAMPVNATLVVYPGILPIDELFKVTNKLQGDVPVKRWIMEDLFLVSGAREYFPGDSMNRINWNATARQGRLMVRKNDFTSSLSLSVILNIQSMEYEQKDVVYRERIELGIKAAATLLDKALRTGSPVRLATNGITGQSHQVVLTEQASGREHTGALLEILSRLELVNVRDFEDFLENISSQLSDSEIVLITCYLNNRLCGLLRSLRMWGNTIRIILLGPLAEGGNIPADMEVYRLAGDVNEREV